jgi:hypothetical protein
MRQFVQKNVDFIQREIDFLNDHLTIRGIKNVPENIFFDKEANGYSLIPEFLPMAPKFIHKLYIRSVADKIMLLERELQELKSL